MDSASASDIIIRDGRESDCEEIMKLIKDLAVYEEMADQVQITAEDLKRDAFHANPPVVYTLVAELSEDTLPSGTNPSENNRIVGHVLYYKTYSTWKGQAMHLEDIFVQPEYRFKGVGEKFLTHLANIAKKENYQRITFECIDWNESAQKFYRKFGAENVTVKEHWLTYRFKKDALKKLATTN